MSVPQQLSEAMLRALMHICEILQVQMLMCGKVTTKNLQCNTYPDITLLPALARLLKINLNTLMSFNDDLTDREIENFVNEVDKTVQEQEFLCVGPAYCLQE